MPPLPRRVVTGLDPQGRSKVLFDGPIPASAAGPHINLAWRTETVPASNEGDAETATPFENGMLNDASSRFMVVQVQPGSHPLMHATNSIDYLIVLSGRILLKLETEEVTLEPGDLIVDRGVLHGWTALGDEPGVMACVMVPAEPLGPGARMEGR
jgi:quercetin dioxygenase-like cupin family protein